MEIRLLVRLLLMALVLVLVDTADQTGNTARYDYISVYFDRQTGMLVQLTRIEFFTNPEIQLTTTWQLVGSNVWEVQ